MTILDVMAKLPIGLNEQTLLDIRDSIVAYADERVSMERLSCAAISDNHYKTTIRDCISLSYEDASVWYAEIARKLADAVTNHSKVAGPFG